MVAQALDGDGVATDAATAPRPTMGLLDATLDLLERFQSEQLAMHTRRGHRRVRQRHASPGVVYNVRLTNGVAVCDCPGFSYRGNCKHSREVIRRGA